MGMANTEKVQTFFYNTSHVMRMLGKKGFTKSVRVFKIYLLKMIKLLKMNAHGPVAQLVRALVL
jgi:hypothetical protein